MAIALIGSLGAIFVFLFHDKDNRGGISAVPDKEAKVSNREARFSRSDLHIFDLVERGWDRDGDEVRRQLNVPLEVLVEAAADALASSRSVQERREAISLIFKVLAQRDVGQSLQLLHEVMLKYPQGWDVFPSGMEVIEACARQPSVLIEWLRLHPEYFANQNDEKNLYESVVWASAEHDLGVALSAAEEFDIPKAHALALAARGVSSFSDRSRIISELELISVDESRGGRGDGDLPAERNRVLINLGRSITLESIDEFGEWLMSVRLTNEEKFIILEGIRPPGNEDERTIWYDWVGKHLGEQCRHNLEKKWNSRSRYR